MTSKRRLPPYDAAKSAEVDKLTATPPIPVAPTSADDSLDAILQLQLAGLSRLTRSLVRDITAGVITKETPNQLATCIKVTMELKQRELELLEQLTAEDLEAMDAN
jgi:hypothetical protein